ncbi:MAG: hypothetical protein AAB383_01760 [Patescibacteria group bacterium]
MTFQFQLLTSLVAKRFTPALLKEARKVFKQIRMALVEADPELDPFRVPSFDTAEELVFFLAMVGDDEWIKKAVDVFEFVEKGRHFIGLGLRRDREMWLGEEGRTHLNASAIQAFTPLVYVKKQVAAYLKLRGTF